MAASQQETSPIVGLMPTNLWTGSVYQQCDVTTITGQTGLN